MDLGRLAVYGKSLKLEINLFKKSIDDFNPTATCTILNLEIGIGWILGNVGDLGGRIGAAHKIIEDWKVTIIDGSWKSTKN